MKRTLLAVCVALAAPAAPAQARESFSHVGTFNIPGTRAGPVTSAEIVAAAKDGRTLLYTDSPSG